MYETMAVWETDPSFPSRRCWPTSRRRGRLDKVVHTTTNLSRRAALAPAFDGRCAVAEGGVSADLLVGSRPLPTPCSAWWTSQPDPLPCRDRRRQPALPNDLRLDLELIDERRFGNGAVHVAYRVRP
jgi:hypothetical protein